MKKSEKAIDVLFFLSLCCSFLCNSFVEKVLKFSRTLLWMFSLVLRSISSLSLLCLSTVLFLRFDCLSSCLDVRVYFRLSDNLSERGCLRIFSPPPTTSNKSISTPSICLFSLTLSLGECLHTSPFNHVFR